MRNPWLKKNPLMSMWLTGINSAAGSARGRMTAEANRQAAAAVAEASRQTLRFWSGGLLTPPRAGKRKKAR